MLQVLKLHPDSRAAAVAVEAEATRDGSVLALRYRLTGDLAALRLPAAAKSARTDELWRHTCFEAFVGAAGGEAYCELNFAPSTEWAAYAFDGYRAGMRAADLDPPRIAVRTTADAVELEVVVDLSRALASDTPWRLGLSAVIEAAEGGVSYWALAHPAGRADFHHRDCFAAELPEALRP